MTRLLLFIVMLAGLAGCVQNYQRDLQIAEPVSKHRFVKVEFTQYGHPKMLSLFGGYVWSPVREFALVSDDGWKLVIQEGSTVGYNWYPGKNHKGEPVHFSPGMARRMWLIDPQGQTHPVKIEIGEPTPRPPQVTKFDPPTTQPDWPE